MRPAGFLPILISKYVIGLCRAMSIAEEKIARCQTFIYYLLLSSLYISLDKLRNSSEMYGSCQSVFMEEVFFMLCQITISIKGQSQETTIMVTC